MTLIEIFSIILIHFVADFWLQTEQQGLNKSKNWNDLLAHTFNYSLAFWCFIMGFTKGDVFISFYFWLITFITHTITDYFTSRITSARYKNSHFYGINGFWFWISVDQFAHVVQLFGVYYLLVKI